MGGRIWRLAEAPRSRAPRSYRVSQEIAPHLPLYCPAEKELAHARSLGTAAEIKILWPISKDSIYVYFFYTRTFCCFDFNSSSDHDNESRCWRMLRKYRGSFSNNCQEWACCRLDHNTRANRGGRMPVSLYFRAGTREPPHTFMGRTLNLNRFDLLYLFRRIREIQ